MDALGLVTLGLEGAAWWLQRSVDEDLEALGYGDTLDAAFAAQGRVNGLRVGAVSVTSIALGTAGAAVVVRF